jgi:hypothetical protein
MAFLGDRLPSLFGDQLVGITVITTGEVSVALREIYHR